MRDYQLVSPSLDGILSHDSLTYEGIRRPVELLRVLDGPASPNWTAAKNKSSDRSRVVPYRSPEDQKILNEYFSDLYGVFMKKLSCFAVESSSSSSETLQLQAMLQELIKIKGLLEMA